MPLDGNPDAGLLVDKTTLNSDLKGVPTAEQFNPPSLTYTESTIRSFAHSIPPSSTAPTQSVGYDKTQGNTLSNSAKHMDGTPVVDPLADMTTLDSDPKGDPTAEQFNPTNLAHTATPTSPDNLSRRPPAPTSTLPPIDPDPPLLRRRTTNQLHTMTLTLPNLEDMRGEAYSRNDSAPSSQGSDTESNDLSDIESLGDDFLAGHGTNKGFTALIVHKDFGFVGKIPGPILGLIHEILQLILRPERSIEVRENPGLCWECGDYMLCAAPMDFLIDLGIEDALIPRPSPPRGKPPKKTLKLVPISSEEGISRLETALMLQDTTLDHIYKMEMRTGRKWRFDIDSPMTPNSNLRIRGS